MHTVTRTKPSIRLTRAGYWQELEKMVIAKTMPIELANLLKGLISCELNSLITTPATPQLIELVKAHVPEGIMLISEGIDAWYDIMIYVPNEGIEDRRSFFKLIQKYPDGNLRYVRDL